MASRNQRRAESGQPVDPPRTPAGEPGSFTENQLMWSDSRLSGRRRELDQLLGSQRTGSAEELNNSRATFEARAANPKNNEATRNKAQSGMERIDRITRDDPTGGAGHRTEISDVQNRYKGILDRATNYAIENDTAIPGTGWYFEHNRAGAAALPEDHEWSHRQVTAIGGKLSSSKTPEDERASMSGIYDLTTSRSEAAVDGKRVSEMSSEEVGRAASLAAGYATRRETGKTQSSLTSPDPQTDPETYDALRRAGRAHADNTIAATRVARGEVSPGDVYDPGNTPKTSAYAEMQAQSIPGSLVETDYRNISAHYRDVKAGKEMEGQGMFMFSADKPGPRPHALSSHVPTAIDTWMVATGSGHELSGRMGDDGKGRPYSPAKNLADKDMPHDPGRLTKGQLNDIGKGDTSMTSQAMVSAQHNEAIRRLSENTIGAVSHDQHGQNIYVPAGLVQETVWTQGRREAGGDKPFNAQQREAASSEKAEAKRTAKIQKQNQQRSLF